MSQDDQQAVDDRRTRYEARMGRLAALQAALTEVADRANEVADHVAER